jgi:signal peptidase I
MSDEERAGGRLRDWRRRPGTAQALKPRSWWRLFELPVLIVVAVALAVLLKSFVAQPFFIPSASMEPTLHGCPTCQGDRVITNKLTYKLRSVHDGDIIVFHDPATWNSETVQAEPSNPIAKAVLWAGRTIGVASPRGTDLIKRVIATGGQSIRCCDSTGRLQVRAAGSSTWVSLDEPYVANNTPLAARAFGPVTVPQGRLWVMGDNRANSADSLFHYERNQQNVVDSTVSDGAVIGKAALIAWPLGRMSTLGTPPTFKGDGLAAGPASFSHLSAALLAVVLVLAIAVAIILWRRARARVRARAAPG